MFWSSQITDYLGNTRDKTFRLDVPRHSHPWLLEGTVIREEWSLLQGTSATDWRPFTQWLMVGRDWLISFLHFQNWRYLESEREVAQLCPILRMNNIKDQSCNIGEGNGTPLQYSCLENPMDGGAWWAAVHGVARSRTQLSDFTFTFHFHALEEEMATHSSVLAWRIPGMGEPGGLPSMGSHRVGHDWSDLAAAAASCNI